MIDVAALADAVPTALLICFAVAIVGGVLMMGKRQRLGRRVFAVAMACFFAVSGFHDYARIERRHEERASKAREAVDELYRLPIDAPDRASVKEDAEAAIIDLIAERPSIGWWFVGGAWAAVAFWAFRRPEALEAAWKTRES